MSLRYVLFSRSKEAHLVLLTFITKFFAFLSLKGLYPLIAFLEVDWQISRKDFSTLLAVSEISAVPALLFAPFADKYNVKTFCIVSWSVITMTSIAQAFDLNEGEYLEIFNDTDQLLQTNPRSFSYFLTIRIIFAMSSQVFLTSNLGIILAALPEDIKHAAAGIVEYSWALSALIGIPLISVIYQAFGVFWAFMIPAIVMLIISVDLTIFLCFKNIQVKTDNHKSLNTKELFKDLTHISFLLFCTQRFLLFLPYNGIFTVIGLWFSDRFDRAVGQIGVSFFIFGGAELLGAALYSLVAAHYNSHIFRGAYVATAVFFCATALLAFVQSYTVALVYVCLTFASFEYIAIAIIVEAASFVNPNHRVTALAMHQALGSLGRSIGAILSERLYSMFEFKTTLLCLSIIVLLSGGFLYVSKRCKRNFNVTVPIKIDKIIDDGTSSEESIKLS